MVQRLEILLTDDLDQSPAARTVSFALDGAHFEIDLSDEHIAELRDALSPWISAARRTDKPRRTRRRRASNSQSDIRQWAQRNGYDVNNRGRLSRDVVDAYTAAHNR